MRLEPSQITTFPNGAVRLSVVDDQGNLVVLTGTEALAQVQIAGQPEQLALITSADKIVFTVPPLRGEYDGTVTISNPAWAADEVLPFHISIRDVGGSPFEVTVAPLSGTAPYRADLYDPRGTMVDSVALEPYYSGFMVQGQADADWIEGTYKAIIRDSTGAEKDIQEFYVDKPDYASAPTFWSLPEKQRLLLEYAKYDLMGDMDPLPPGALQTIEQYAKHWRGAVWDMNIIMPHTKFEPGSIPHFWYYTALKGTALKFYWAMANRAVTIPRFTGVPTVIQDESHLQASWMDMYDRLKPEWRKEAISIKAQHLPRPAVTLDPFLGWVGGSMAGTSMINIMGRPTWFTRPWTGR